MAMPPVRNEPSDLRINSAMIGGRIMLENNHRVKEIAGRNLIKKMLRAQVKDDVADSKFIGALLCDSQMIG